MHAWLYWGLAQLEGHAMNLIAGAIYVVIHVSMVLGIRALAWFLSGMD